MDISIFQSLADPTRFAILEILRKGERTVNDITEAVPIRQSGVSRHLRILHESGFVKVRREGQKRLYSISPGRFRELDQWVAGYRHFWEARLDTFAEALQTRQHRRRSKLAKLKETKP
jgi:DNA-binding transcriptional ArsR family regulator